MDGDDLKKVEKVKGIYYSRIINSEIKEGGLARDKAFLNFFLLNLKNEFEVICLESDTLIKKIYNSLLMNGTLFFSRKRKFFFHMFSVSILLRNIFLFNRVITVGFINTYDYFFKKNEVIFEINDLYIEQSEAMEFKLKKSMEELQFFIFSLKNVKYIFASESMKDYAVDKYKISSDRCFVCINGGYIGEKRTVTKSAIKEEIEYVYAGTLNRGRQIEELMRIFSEIKGVKLYLMGTNGEWLLSHKLSKNIIYLGALEEREAYIKAETYDVGIIPYSEERFYYNLCFPTKNSFYIMAGLPFICTNLVETKYWFEKYGCCWFEKIENWDILIKKITREEIDNKKIIVDAIKQNFEWNYVINKLFYDIEKNRKL